MALGDSTPGTVNVGGQAAPGAAGSVLTVTQVAAGGTLASWSTTAGTVGSAGVASFATNSGTSTLAAAVIGPTTGTAAIATSTLVTSIGPNATVAGNWIGSGSVLSGYFIGSFNASAAGTATFGVYWGGTGGILLGTSVGYTSSDNESSFVLSFTTVWTSASAAQFNMTGGSPVSSLVTGLTTTSATVITQAINWNHNGSGTFTPVFAQITGYSQGTIGV
jgi:hypothetical protein